MSKASMGGHCGILVNGEDGLAEQDELLASCLPIFAMSPMLVANPCLDVKSLGGHCGILVNGEDGLAEQVALKANGTDTR